jgi:methionyl-tRNA formyltransferase
MRLIFLGTPDFAVPTLEGLLQAGHQVLLVVTQPDRPSGRGQELAASPIKQAALRWSLPLYQPERIKPPEVTAYLASSKPEAMVLAGYGKIIPQSIIGIPPRGIINVHASLLPKYRGAAPIQWAIARGETRTGVSTMRIDAGLDTGDILLQAETEIAPEETALELSERLARLGAGLLLRTLEGLQTGVLTPMKQDPALASYAPVLKKEDGLIDWGRRASEIHNRVRGFVPWPGCYSRFRGGLLLIWKTRLAEPVAGPPGSLRADRGRLRVACGQGTALELLEVQLEGRKRIPASAFQSGQRLLDNEVLGEMGA